MPSYLVLFINHLERNQIEKNIKGVVNSEDNKSLAEQQRSCHKSQKTFRVL